MKKLLFTFLIASPFVNAQNVNIPDANFKAYLLQSSSNFFIALDITSSQMQIDANSDGEIQVSEALNVYELKLISLNSPDLTGLESFTNLTTLFCENNNSLTSIDLTALTNLTTLMCGYNSLLSSIDLSTIPNLTTLNCSWNTSLTSIDLSAVPNLTRLYNSGNPSLILNLSLVPNLTALSCNHDGLNSIDLSVFSNLVTLDCSNNSLSSIDLSAVPNLTDLNCSNNSINSIDLSLVPNLTSLACSGNNISPSIDVTTNLYLDNLWCSDNNLTHLFLKNGKNISLYFDNNPDLTYICADDIQYDSIIYNLTSFNYTNVEVNSYCSFTPGGDHNTISGNFIYDADNNGCDMNDPSNIQFQKITNQSANVNGIDFADDLGEYNFFTQEGSFIITPINENATFFNITPPNATIVFTDNNNNLSVQDFCISANGVHPDLEVVLSPYIPARPGFDASYTLVYKNKGNQTLSGDIQLIFNDNVLDLVSSTVNPTSTTVGNLGWAYTALLPFETKSINLVFNVNSPMEIPAVNIGDILTFGATITLSIGDETPLDNQFTYNQTVVGAYDPNIITCLEGATLAPAEIGNYLHYAVDFENTGNFPAENIVVVENIDPSKYDISTLQVLNSSNDISTNINGNRIEFIFENINLGAQEHGNFLIKIKSLDTLTVGDSVSQFADIYFDYNFPVQTNNAETIYKELTNGLTEKMLDQTISVFPNPSTGNFLVKAESQIKSIELFDVNGRLIVTKIVNEKSVKIDISEREKGIYFVKSTTENGVQVMEVIKE